VVKERKLLTQEKWDEVFSFDSLTSPVFEQQKVLRQPPSWACSSEKSISTITEVHCSSSEVLDTQDNKVLHGLERHVPLSALKQFAEKDLQMSVKRIVREMMVLAALLSIAGCGHVQTMSTPNPVTVQDFGCHGDKPCPYAPYCRP